MGDILNNLTGTIIDPNLSDIGYLSPEGKKALGIVGSVNLVDSNGSDVSLGDVEVALTTVTGGTYTGKSSSATNADFYTTYAGATTITLSGYPAGVTAFTGDDIEFVRQINTSGEVIATYGRDDAIMAIAANVLTVTGATFAPTDRFVISTNVPRSYYANTTNVETLVSESALPGIKPTCDSGGTATSLLDAAAFDEDDINSVIGYTVYNITDGESALVESWNSIGEITTGAGVTDWEEVVYSVPVVSRYVIDMDTYNFLTLHYRLSCDASSNAYLRIFGTLDEDADDTSDDYWVDLTADVFGAVISVAPSTVEEDIVELREHTVMLKYMIQLIITDSAAAASGNEFTIFTKKS